MILRATKDGWFEYGPTPDKLTRVRCALGKNGLVAAEDKREGDGASPVGHWPIRRALFRPDRLARPHTRLVIDPTQPEDGWCDSPEDPAYNRPVRLPYAASCETLQRQDELYDIVVILGHNDDPPVPGLGSAIFLHCAKPGYPPTLGCVALAKEDLIDVLGKVSPGDRLEITV
ncbi:hypothetical protein GCM10011367_25410 [Marinicauda pacifica]|uniref:L,D-TPase catalytic domain-containing protein n=1 Tax=Marinicauda pacifica TaxID=1133559 RepID=A0A4S2H9T6_9PROT|nr:hypothetical protein E5162_12775 [Marinicauda pacifica]GGE49458.1 hypothetical protein GCM10011367_25410 [Marinicauda pacifica]